MGDVMFNGLFPYIDLDSGGSVAGMILAIEDMLTRIDADTRIIPGHGPLADRHSLVVYRDMLVTVRDRIQDAVDRGLSLEEVMAEGPTAEYDAEWAWNFITTDRFVRIVYTDLTANDDR